MSYAKVDNMPQHLFELFNDLHCDFPEICHSNTNVSLENPKPPCSTVGFSNKTVILYNTNDLKIKLILLIIDSNTYNDINSITTEKIYSLKEERLTLRRYKRSRAKYAV